jgi:hypothetical protein
MHPSSGSPFSNYLDSSTFPISGIRAVIQPLAIRDRKIILTICRCQSVPRRGSKLYQQVVRGYPEYEKKRIATKEGASISLSQIIESLRDYILDPIPNGFIQMLVKVLPLEDDDVEAAVVASYEKEICASQERRYRPRIDLISIFGETWRDRSRPLFQNWTTFHSGTHRNIFSGLCRAIPLCKDTC